MEIIHASSRHVQEKRIYETDVRETIYESRIMFAVLEAAGAVPDLEARCHQSGPRLWPKLKRTRQNGEMSTKDFIAN